MTRRGKFPACCVLVVVFMAARAGAEPWRATAKAARAGLPEVDVELGYSDSYVPAASAPIAFRARTGGQPFDGYIGFHTAIGERQTPDTSVVARAVMKPHAQWTFSTWAPRVMGTSSWVKGYFRSHELVVEWRDRGQRLLAKRSVGVPPWVHPPRPLRVVRAAGEPVAEDAFGEKAVVVEAASLSASPQWYAGFASVVIPTALWLELPRPVREAIFRSAIEVVFVGIPERIPPMDGIGRALLPVDFRPSPGVVEVPWPYRGAQARTIPTAVTWQAKPGAWVVGSDASPWLAANSAATFLTGEEALREPLPSFKLRFKPLASVDIKTQRPTVAQLLDANRTGVVFTLLAVFSIAMWIVIRRRPHLAVLVVSVAVTLAALGWRHEIRPAADHHLLERLDLTAPGIVDVVRFRESYGPSPRPAQRDQVAAAAGERVTGHRDREGDDIEVRTSSTPPGFGDLYTPGRPWIFTRVATRQRELGSPASMRVLSRDAHRLVVEYASTLPVDAVAAEWNWKGLRHYGETRVTSRRGVATIVDSHFVWGHTGFWSWADEIWRDGSMPDPAASIGLLHVGQNRRVLTRVAEIGDASAAQPSFVFVPLRRGETGDLSAMFFLPGRIPDAARVTLSLFGGPVHQVQAEKDIAAYILEGSGGTLRVKPDRSNHVLVAAADLQRIAPGRGLVRVTVQTSPSAAEVTSAVFLLKIRERRP